MSSPITPHRKQDSSTEDILRILTEKSPTVRAYRAGSRFGMLVGGLVLIGGFIMFVMGLSGSIERSRRMSLILRIDNLWFATAVFSA